jgi:Neuraminidase (sialidase)
VTADSLDPNAAYAVWDRLVSPSLNANPSAFDHSPAFRGPAFFSKTTDGGQTWSQGRVIFDPGEKNQTIGNQIVVPSAGPAKGVLIDGFDLITTKGGKGHNQRSTDSVAVIRSTNGGASWSAPIIVAPEQVAPVTIAGHPVRSSDTLPEFAVGPEGNLYAVWQDARFSPTGTSKIAFSMSSDGGLTWTTPIRADQSVGDTPAVVPSIHASSDGTVGLSYYDLEPATSANPGLRMPQSLTAIPAARTAQAGLPMGRLSSARPARSITPRRRTRAATSSATTKDSPPPTRRSIRSS